MRIKSLLSFGLIALLTLVAPIYAAAATALDTGKIAIVVQTGQTADGTKTFRVATDQDEAAKQFFNWIARDTAVDRVADYYVKAQKMRNDEVVESIRAHQSLTDGDRALLDDLAGPERVFIEVKNGDGGAVCDWKAHFQVKDANGKNYEVTAPRVVLQTADPVFAGGNAALRSQTLVHEIGHGVMSVAYGVERLPTTHWLKLSHSGIMVTDEKLSLIEGWAEFVGANFTGRLTIAEDPPNTIPNNAYAYTEDGQPKNANALWKTEGWASTVLYHLSSGGQIENFDEKVLKVMMDRTPQTFKALLEDFERVYPEDKDAVRSVVSRDSFGQVYPEYGSGSSTVPPPVITRPPTTTSQPFDFAGFDAASTASTSGGLAPVLTAGLGAVLGVAIIGGPLGVILGGIAGALLGTALSKNFTSTANSPLSSLLAPAAPTAAPKITAPDTADDMVDGSPAKNLRDARAAYREAMRIYLRALEGSDPTRQEAARKAYGQARDSYRKAKKTGLQR